LAVGQGYKITGVVDYEHVRELARINGDLGRLGGLLKLWLTDDPRTARFGDATILALLAKIEEKQDELGKVMMGVVRPRAEP
ncbi:conjugal transfer transcriptional regulator TraJ, partial [Staphylococcus aureus]|nr:conjugal transfer transcriptional regulator TraJ [Staphylococcus aureus]